MASKKQRLDTLLVELGFCDSRQSAQRYIRAGAVQVNCSVIDKPGTQVDIDLPIKVKQRLPYVSRGADKLLKALQTFPIEVRDRICLDGGISTGGFTDCLLQSGAQKVFGIDVGYGQVAWKIRSDPRVVLRERTNIRTLTPDELYSADEARPTLGVMDLSFISLGKVLPSLWALLQAPREVLLLVKPQFEVGRAKIGKNGVVRNAKDQAEAIATVLEQSQAIGWHYQGLTHSPLQGPAGNIEYLLWLSEIPLTPIEPPTLATFNQITQTAHQLLKPADKK
jgi:23S rRNA (cytidine1920-2'-O)/16S rRNA (cytidine1409-2'-O)-methyltransferase